MFMLYQPMILLRPFSSRQTFMSAQVLYSCIVCITKYKYNSGIFIDWILLSIVLHYYRTVTTVDVPTLLIFLKGGWTRDKHPIKIFLID